MEAFDRRKYAPVKCIVRVEDLEFACEDKTGAKIRASMSVDYNSETIYTECDLGDIRSKTGVFQWKKEFLPNIPLPLSFPVIVKKNTELKIKLTEVSGIPFLTRSKNVLHS